MKGIFQLLFHHNLNMSSCATTVMRELGEMSVTSAIYLAILSDVLRAFEEK